MALRKLFAGLIFAPLFLVSTVSAHCPLCTAGAAVAAGGAVYLGVSKVVVSLFIGAFAMSMGMWFSKVIKKKYVPFQNFLLITAIFLATVLPIMPIMIHTVPYYLSLFGGYGTLFNKTYMINLSLYGSLFGGLIMFVSPSLNKKIKKIRDGKGIPFQGILITFLLLLISGGIIQLSV